jgi:hypothetical protein
LAKIKFEPIFFQVLWQFLETGGQPAEGGQSGSGWRAEFSAAANEFRSNFFVNPPPGLTRLRQLIILQSKIKRGWNLYVEKLIPARLDFYK